MIWAQIAFDIVIVVLFYALWSCVQKISWSHYNLTQYVKANLTKDKS